MRAKYVVIGVVLGLLLLSAAVVLAGSLDSPGSPTDAAAQMYTVEQIYNQLDTGAAATKMTTFTEPSAGPDSTGRTLDEVMGLAMAVGNPDPPCFDNTNRYVDCGNGTVNDTVTNLIWLKNANCYGALNYAAANNAAAGLEDGECGLTDGSSPGDWRLPTKEEWETTLARAVELGCESPSLTDTPGTGCYSAGTQPFTGVMTYSYSSSTSDAVNPDYAWYVDLSYGYLVGYYNKVIGNAVWPVRAGQ